MDATVATEVPTAATGHVPLVAWLAVMAAMAALYLVLQENGAVLAQSWDTVHEFFHDGRHLFGVTCH